MMEVGRTFVRIIRYGVIVQVPLRAGFRPLKHLPFPQNSPALACPLCKLSQASCKCLATGTPLHLELPIPGFATIVGKTQKCELFWLLPSPLCIPTRKTAKFNAACLLFGYFQAKMFNPLTQPILEVLCI